MEQVNALATPVDFIETILPIGDPLPCVFEVRPTMAYTVIVLAEPKRLAFTCPLGAFNMHFLFSFEYQGRPCRFYTPVGYVAPEGAGWVEPKEEGGKWR